MRDKRRIDGDKKTKNGVKGKVKEEKIRNKKEIKFRRLKGVLNRCGGTEVGCQA